MPLKRRAFPLLGWLGPTSAAGHLVRLHAPGARVHGLRVGHAVAFLQQLVHHVVSVHKEIRAAVVLLQKAEAFLVIEKPRRKQHRSDAWALLKSREA